MLVRVTTTQRQNQSTNTKKPKHSSTSVKRMSLVEELLSSIHYTVALQLYPKIVALVLGACKMSEATNTSLHNASSLTSHVPRNEVTDLGVTDLGRPCHVAVKLNTIRNGDTFEVQSPTQHHRRCVVIVRDTFARARTSLHQTTLQSYLTAGCRGKDGIEMHDMPI